MRAWWEGLQARERLMVGIGGGLLAILLAYLLAVEPVLNHLERLRTEVREGEELQVWMREALVKIRALEATQGAPRVEDNRSLFAIVDQSVRRYQLGSVLTSLEPSGPDQVALGFEEVGFDRLITWLDQVETEGTALVESLSVSRTDEQGRVDARLTLRRPTS
jgi:general secretion pathway protein M